MRRWSREVGGAVVCLGLGLAAGCAGSGRVEIASLNTRSIDPPAPRVTRLEMDRCYWWTDEKGQVWIAMEREVPSLLGELGVFRFQLSLVLERLPAGRARNYTTAERELRAAARVGPWEVRFASLSGIAALYREAGPSNRLRGSLRLLVSQEINQLLGGWSRPSRHLLLATFLAVPDTGRGRQIAAATETLGGQRDSPETTGEERTSSGTSQPQTRPALGSEVSGQ